MVVVGPAIAFLLAGSLLFPIRLERDGDPWEVRIMVRVHIPATVNAAVSLLVGGILSGHRIREHGMRDRDLVAVLAASAGSAGSDCARWVRLAVCRANVAGLA